MFYIDQTTTEFKHAMDEHYKNVRYVIKKKLLGKHFTEAHPKGLTREIQKVNGIHSTVATFFSNESNLKDVLLGTPEVLNMLKLRFTAKKAIESIKLLLPYVRFISKKEDDTFGFYNAFHLAENLDSGACIYCNRLYTNTIITDQRKFVARATFDHWFPKSSYPILALSFYNLIPSCNVCNSSIKGTTPLAIKDIFHPYLKHSDPKRVLDFTFSYDLEDHIHSKNKFKFGNKFSEKSVEVMQLEEMYKIHNEEVRDLIFLKKAYSDAYLSSLRSLLKVSVSNNDLYRLAFGIYLEDHNLMKRPLSKLKKDVLSELGILKP